MAQIEVRGLARLNTKLGRAGANQILERPMAKSLAIVEGVLKTEPPPRPGQRYIRGRGPTNAAGVVIRETSEHLSATWSSNVTQSPSGVRGQLRNNVSYAPWVVSDQWQAWMHKGRWTTDVQAIDRNMDRIRQIFNDEVAKELGDNNG